MAGNAISSASVAVLMSTSSAFASVALAAVLVSAGFVLVSRGPAAANGPDARNATATATTSIVARVLVCFIMTTSTNMRVLLWTLLKDRQTHTRRHCLRTGAGSLSAH